MWYYVHLLVGITHRHREKLPEYSVCVFVVCKCVSSHSLLWLMLLLLLLLFLLLLQSDVDGAACDDDVETARIKV